MCCNLDADLQNIELQQQHKEAMERRNAECATLETKICELKTGDGELMQMLQAGRAENAELRRELEGVRDKHIAAEECHAICACTDTYVYEHTNTPVRKYTNIRINVFDAAEECHAELKI